MTDDEKTPNDMTENGEVKSEKKKPGRPKKPVKKSPEKNMSDTSELFCPCKSYIPSEISIACENCSMYWHLCCVGLKGLTDEMTQSLERWECPNCFYSPYTRGTRTLSTSPSSADNRTLQVMLKEELHLMTPVIRVTVEDAMRRALPDNICSKEDIKTLLDDSNNKAVKSYAEVTATSQKKVIEEMSIAQASKTVVEEVARKMDVDKIEREKRKFNVCVMGVPDSTREEAKHRNGDDYRFCINTLEIAKGDIAKCYRAGRPDSSKPTSYCRPLIVEMVDEQAVSYWTNCGKGYRTDSDHYINMDLCNADRKAHFLARQEAKRRRETRTSAEGNKKVQDPRSTNSSR